MRGRRVLSLSAAVVTGPLLSRGLKRGRGRVSKARWASARFRLNWEMSASQTKWYHNVSKSSWGGMCIVEVGVQRVLQHFLVLMMCLCALSVLIFQKNRHTENEVKENNYHHQHQEAKVALSSMPWWIACVFVSSIFISIILSSWFDLQFICQATSMPPASFTVRKAAIMT